MRVISTAAVAALFLAVVVASTVSRTCEDSSLVQLRTSKLVMNGSILGSLEHSEELAVQLRQMAMVKASHGSVQPNYTVFRLDENASETTLQIVNDSMNTFLDQVNVSFHNDLQEIQLIIQNANECNQELSDEQAALGLNVTSVNDNVVAAEAQHDLCRVSENSTYHANVTAFDALKSTVDLQLQRVDQDEVQVPEVRCMRNYIRSSNPPFSQNYAQPSQYADAAACAEEIRDWSASYSAQLGGRLANFTSANQIHADKISECNTYQSQYEQSFCSYKSNLLHVCGELDRCFGHIQSLYSATRELIVQSNETRFRSFLVANKVACYINVLLRNLTIAAIHECDQNQINTSELNFTFPSLPTKAACNVSLVSVSPCDNEWIQTKYTDKPWYATGAVQNAPCEACGIATTTTTSLAVSTIVASRYALCATTPITPMVSNLKCVTSVGSASELLGGNPGYVLLGTDRRALEVLGPTSYTMCAKLDNASVKCWGSNDYGQLGLGDTTERGQTTATMGDNLTILNLGSNLTILKVVSGEHHACAVVSNGKMKCWGRNQYGQLGRPETGDIFGDETNEIGDQMPFVNFRSDEEVADAAAGWTTTCAIFKNTSLACWGNNRQGMLGRGSSILWSAAPQLVDLGAGHHAIQVAVGAVHICALLNTSKVKCWGAGSFGRLGNGGGDTRDIGSVASDMGDNLSTLPLDHVKQIAVGTFSAHTCAILENNGVTCWGYNNHRQALPSSSDQTAEISSTQLIPLNDGSGQNVNATELALSDVFSCARLRNQSIHCWGRTSYIQNYETLS